MNTFGDISVLYGLSPNVTISQKRTPNDHTSDIVVDIRLNLIKWYEQRFHIQAEKLYNIDPFYFPKLAAKGCVIDIFRHF